MVVAVRTVVPENWIIEPLMPEQEHLGAIVRSLRRKRGLSQTELAIAAGLDPAHQSTISKIELGMNLSPKSVVLPPLERFFHLEPDTLVVAALRTQRAMAVLRQRDKYMLVPNHPLLKDHLEVLFKMEEEQIQSVTETARAMREEEVERRQREAREQAQEESGT